MVPSQDICTVQKRAGGHASTRFAAIAAIPRRIPARAEIPILPVVFLNHASATIPSRIAPIARRPVRMTHDRMPRMRLIIPGQFHFRFGVVTGAGPGAGTTGIAAG